jgi:hypothetical protein
MKARSSTLLIAGGSLNANSAAVDRLPILNLPAIEEHVP